MESLSRLPADFTDNGHGTSPAPHAIARAECLSSDDDMHHQQYLPTPTSLPIHSHLRDILETARSSTPLTTMTDLSDLARPARASPTSSTLSGRDRSRIDAGTDASREPSSDAEPRQDEQRARGEEGLPFEIEMELDTEDSQMLETAATQHRQNFAVNAPSPFSSSHRPFRTTRARYASSESASSPPPASFPQFASAATGQDDPAPSHKRTHSFVSAATGQSQPSRSLAEREPAMLSPPASPGAISNSSSVSTFAALDVPLPSSSLSNDIAQHPLFRASPLAALEERASPEHPRIRTHSFESQRASAVRASGRRTLRDVARESLESGDSSRSSSLRRRSPAIPSVDPRNDLERGGSKRRRASTLLAGDLQRDEPLTISQLGSRSFAPALGRYPSQVSPIEPVLSRPATSSATANAGLSRSTVPAPTRPSSQSPVTSGSLHDLDAMASSTDVEDRRASSRHSFSRLPPWWRTSHSAGERSAPPSLSGSLAIGTSSSFLPTPPLNQSVLTPPPLPGGTSFFGSRFSRLNAFSADEHVHSELSSRLDSHTDHVLRQAEETLRTRQAVLQGAEETTRRARQLLEEDREDRERERRISTLPDVGGLPEPAELSARPVIGLRIGEGWPATTQATSAEPRSPPPGTARRRRSSIFSSLSPPSSPDEGTSDSLALGGSSSRTRQFLTSLRARRPRFSRNSTGNLVTDSPSPTLGDSATFASQYDEEAEHRAATALNEHFLERRRISASLEPPSQVGEAAGASVGDGRRSSGLWGETLIRTSRSRLRGPTEGQNERWRRGQAPASTTGSTTAALVSQPGASSNSGIATPLNGAASGPARYVAPSIDNNATDSSATAYFSRRNDSPSPNRNQQAFRRSSMLGSSAGEQPRAGEGANERQVASTQIGLERMLSSDGNRPAIRLPLNPTASGAANAPSSRPRLRFDEDEDRMDAPTFSDRARDRWNPPQLPLMLPSGSEGRRMLFPHPAHASGMSDSLEAAEEGGIHAADSRRWLSDSPERVHDEANPLNYFPFDDLPLPLTTTASADALARSLSDSSANSRIAPRTGPLAETIEDSRQRVEAAAQTIRRRHVVDPSPSEPSERSSRVVNDAVAERLAQHRVERLASLRRERNFMRSILGGADDAVAGGLVGSSDPSERSPWHERTRDSLDLERERRGAGQAPAASPPRSPGFRRRALGDFFRGFGTGGRLISIFDEEYGAFFGRDAVALDSRNYVEDDDFDASYEGLLRLSAQIGDAKPKGVSQEAISQLRTFPYSEWPYIERMSSASPKGREGPIASTSAKSMEPEATPRFARKNIEKEERCAICLCDYEDNDSVSLAKCSHGFHTDCLKSWFTAHGSCPVCRRDHTT